MDAKLLRSIVDYDPLSGIFKWKHNNKYFSFVKAGDEVGKNSRKLGYKSANINHKQYYQHRLAWLYIHGEWPSKPIDHINGIRDDNRIANLRLASLSENQQNRKKTRTKQGLMGAYKDKRSKTWYSTIMTNKVKTHLGSFDTEEKAASAYIEAKAKLHTFSPKIPLRD